MIKLIGERILVKEIENNKLSSGIVLDENIQSNTKKGEVIQNSSNDFEYIKENQIVVFSKYAGIYYESDDLEEKYIILDPRDILGTE